MFCINYNTFAIWRNIPAPIIWQLPGSTLKWRKQSYSWINYGYVMKIRALTVSWTHLSGTFPLVICCNGCGETITLFSISLLAFNDNHQQEWIPDTNCQDRENIMYNCHQKSPQEHIPSSKWWNLLASLTTSTRLKTFETSLVNVWQSIQIRRFFVIRIGVPSGILSRPYAMANLSLCP